MNFLGLKKIILKGKDFVMKKLDELQIQRQQIDYVSEQIPKPLHTQLKTFERSDVDLEPAEEYAEYCKTYPTHPVSPIFYDSIQKMKQEVSYDITPQLEKHENQIPLFDEEQQQKAFRLKNVIDNYKQPVSDIKNTMIGIFVVHFHHKRGTQVQFKYPDNDLTKSLQDRIVHYAMPDSSHNKHEDYNFFNMVSDIQIQGQKRMLFGVSYFKQIKLTDQLKQKQQQLTRSHLQKAVCIVSTLPLFGYLKVRLAQTTKLFFQNFTNFQSVQSAFSDIQKHLNATWKNLDINELYIGTDLRNIIKIFGYKLMQIYKAILYQKRIVIFSHSPSSSSSFILSLLTLFPGMITFGMSNNSVNKYYQSLRQFALPLRLFSKKNPLILSFHIQQFHLLDGFQKPEGKYYLVGTTNRLVKQTKKFSTQVLLNLQNCSIEMSNIDEGGWQGLTSRDKQFMNNLINVLQNTGTQGYKGSDDWIRQQFHNYLKQSLTQIVQAKNMYRKFIKQCELYQASLKNKSKTEEQKSQTKLKVPYINSKILDIPFPYLLSKPSFRYFLQFHNPNIYLLNEQHHVEQIMLLGNNDYYLGKFPRSESKYIHYNLNSRKLKYSTTDLTTKQIKFNANNQIISIEIGKFKENRLIQGFKLNQSQCYSGDLSKGQYHGYGKLTTSEWTYIGNFVNGNFDGEGQLVTNDKVIYMGQFKDGLKNGKGRQQNEQQIRSGLFVSGFLTEGQITYITTKIKISGNFLNNKCIQGQKYMYVFENENSYFGCLKQNKPHGQGIFTRWGKQGMKSRFQDGQFKQQLQNQQQNIIAQQIQQQNYKQAKSQQPSNTTQQKTTNQQKVKQVIQPTSSQQFQKKQQQSLL